MTDDERVAAILKIIGIDFPVAGFMVAWDVESRPLVATVRYYPRKMKKPSEAKSDE